MSQIVTTVLRVRGAILGEQGVMLKGSVDGVFLLPELVVKQYLACGM